MFPCRGCFWRDSWHLAGLRCNVRPMPDDLYDRDILTWSEQQAELLRRLERGERVNGVDWAHVVEEIEDVGLSELHSVQSHLNLMLVHLLKIWLSPNSEASRHWRGEIVAFQKNAGRRFAPSMRQRIDLAKLYEEAIEQLDAAGHVPESPRRWPEECPFTLDQLLYDKWASLEACLNAVETAVQGQAPPTSATPGTIRAP